MIDGEKKVKTISKRQKQEYLLAYAMVGITILGLIILNIIPFIQTIWMSFSKSAMFGEWQFAGMYNYTKMFSDSTFWQATYNTILFVVLTTPIGVMGALILAGFLNTKIKGKSLFRAIYFLPMIVAPTAVAMVWKWMFNSEYGIINMLLQQLGMSSNVAWITNPNVVLISCAIVAIWSSIGYDAILLLSGIQNISSTYYEAAEIDGATSIKKFIYITIPLVSPTLFFVLIMRIMASIKVFDLIYMMVEDSNPAINSARTLMGLFYRESFEKGNKGYASAIVVWTFFIIGVITLIQFIGQKKWVNYDA